MPVGQHVLRRLCMCTKPGSTCIHRSGKKTTYFSLCRPLFSYINQKKRNIDLMVYSPTSRQRSTQEFSTTGPRIIIQFLPSQRRKKEIFFSHAKKFVKCGSNLRKTNLIFSHVEFICSFFFSKSRNV